MAATGTPTNRTNIELDPETASFVIAKAQEQSAIMSLAKKITLPGLGLTIPVITSDPEAEWVAETGAKPVKNPGLSKKIMQAYKLAVIVPFSDEFRRDMKALTQEIINRLPLALAKKFDSTVFHGSAPGSNFDTFASVQKQSLTSDPWQALVDADMDIAMTGNGILNGFVIAPMGRGVLLASKDNDGRPLFVNSAAEGSIPMLLGQKVVASKAAYKAAAGANEAVVGFAGDWSQAIYGIAEGITLTYSDQATLATKDGENNDVMINLWQQNMFAVRAEIEVGFRADTECFNALTYAPSGATGATGATG